MTISRFDISRLTTVLQQRHTILVPNHRSRDAIVHAFAQYQSKNTNTWLAPEVYAIDIWLQDQCTELADLGIAPFHLSRILNRHEELTLWQQIIESSDLTHPLINPVETARAVSRSYRLQQQWINPLAAAGLQRANHSTDVAVYLQWVSAFKERCHKDTVMVLADAVLALMQAIKNKELLLPEQLVLVNFLDPPPLYKSLFQVLSGCCDVSEINTVDDELVREEPVNLRRLSFVDFDEELRSCGNWIKQIRQQDPKAHIGVVMKNFDANEEKKTLIENQLSVIHKSASAYDADNNCTRLPFNLLSQAPNLSANQAIDGALKILALNHNTQSVSDFCQLLSNPAVIGAAQEFENRIKLQTYYRRYSEAEASLADLRQPMRREEKDYYCPILAQALLDFEPRHSQKNATASAITWAAVFQKQLDIMGWTASMQARPEDRIFEQWQDCILILQQADDLLGELTFTAAYQRLKLICSQSVQSNPFAQDCQISVVAAADAVGLHYSHLWLLAADDANWPSMARPDPFLPIKLQHQLAMPDSSSQWQLQHARTMLTHLFNATTKEFVLSHHQQEDDIVLRESPLLRHHPLFQSVDLLSVTAEESDAVSSQNTPAVVLQQIDDCDAVALVDGENVQGGSSLLSDQSNCPFKAFARYRLGANALEEFENGIDNRARGTALHIALQQLWSELKSHSVLLNSTSNEISKQIDNAVTAAISWLRRNFPHTMTAALVDIEKTRLAKLLDDYLLLEQQRSPFTVRETEKRSALQFDKLRLALTVDRIDQLDDGTLVLIDYKTGKKTDFKWFDERPRDLQLPMYQMAIDCESDDDIEAVLISQINAQKIQYLGESNHADLHPDLSKRNRRQKFEGSWSELQQLWNDTISNMADEVSEGVCTVTPTSLIHSCQYCELSRLCRINENVNSTSLDAIASDADD